MGEDLKVFTLRPRPCGHTHAHLSEVLACIEANGNPGLEVAP